MRAKGLLSSFLQFTEVMRLYVEYLLTKSHRIYDGIKTKIPFTYNLSG